VQRSQIEQHYTSGQYDQALEGLSGIDASAWADTTKLRCMRTMGHVDTLAYADQLAIMIAGRSEPYTTNTSDRNNLLRYIALIYSEQNRTNDACKILAALCKQSPDVPALHREYAFALNNDSQLELAETELRRAIKLQPNNAKSHAQLGSIYCRSGRTSAGYNSYSRAATLEPENANYIQRLLYWGNYLEHVTQQGNYQLSRLWANKALADIHAANLAQRDKDPNRLLKLAFVCSDFGAHDIMPFFMPLLEGLRQADYNVTAYSDVKKDSQATEPIRKLCSTWRESSHLNDQELAKQIIADQIDILVDLNGHSGGNRMRLFASRIAPIQVSWLGYPSTTGVKNIDYKISDRVVAPAGLHEDSFNETLLRLPNGLLCYKPPEDAPAITRNNDQTNIRFGSFSNLAKASSLALDCWAAALLAVPKSTLTIRRYELNNLNAANYFLKELAERGISHDRIILKATHSKTDQFLDEYNEIDISLDTTPYNDAITTLESLWMGVPVVSLMGQTQASRVSSSILHRLNLSGLATQTVFEFAERAKELAELEETLESLRFSLRKRMQESALMNNRQFAREFGNTLRSQWRDWCTHKSPQLSVVSQTARADK